MYDDLDISRNTTAVPEKFRRRGFQTKDLDCDLSHYRVDDTGLLLKIIKPIGQPEKLFHSKNLNQDIEIYSYNESIILKVRNGEVTGFDTEAFESDFWDGQEPIWEEFIQSNES